MSFGIVPIPGFPIRCTLVHWLFRLFLTLHTFFTPQGSLCTPRLCHTVTDLQEQEPCRYTLKHIQTRSQTNWHSIEPPVSSCSETPLPCMHLDLCKMGWSSCTDDSFRCALVSELITKFCCHWETLCLTHNNTVAKQVAVGVHLLLLAACNRAKLPAIKFSNKHKSYVHEEFVGNTSKHIHKKVYGNWCLLPLFLCFPLCKHECSSLP